MQDGSIRVVTEEDPGFGAVMDHVVQRFASASGWQAKVIEPPFAPQLTVLYRSED